MSNEDKELRDMIAAGCMIGLLAAGRDFEEGSEKIASAAYELANAYMAEREKHNEG